MLNRRFVVTLEQRCAKQDKYQIAIQVSPATSEAGTCVCPRPWKGHTWGPCPTATQMGAAAGGAPHGITVCWGLYLVPGGQEGAARPARQQAGGMGRAGRQPPPA